jgi:hypothetical protein
LGDKSTRFFHAAVTERYRLNTITSFDMVEGQTLTSHAEKATHIWGEFRNRLSCSIGTSMHFSLQDLIQEHDLQRMEAPFTKEDIVKLISSMPANKAPGPDGFNGLFLKKCWHIIKDDVYNLCQDFLMGWWTYNQ